MADAAAGLMQGQEQRQEQTLTARQLQSLDILASPAMELSRKIVQEMETNPVIEELPPDHDDGEELPEMPPQEQPGCEKEDLEDSLARILELSASGAADEDSDLSFDSHDDDAEERRSHFFNSITGSVSMQEQLLEQLAFSGADGPAADAARLVIGSIDENGYCLTHVADIATGCSCTLEEAEKALALVQSFDPPGIGARDLKECLLLQLKRKKISDPVLEKIIMDSLDDLAANRLPKIAGKLGITLEELNEKISFLRSLNPRPGALISSADAKFVVPDVFVVPDGDEFKVTANKESVPGIRISKNYLEMLENPATDPETRAWLKNRVLSGNSLKYALEQRESTILRIARVIVSCQYDFLRTGKAESLKPMTMRQTADRLDLHETTVSRAVAEKYMKTPVGLFAFSYFFKTGFRSGEGEDVSSRGVQEMIRGLIGEEDPSSPLSDSTLTEKLKEKGLDVARRTVAKYREAMGIPASNLRRKYE